MNNTRKKAQKSSDSPKNPQNTTGLSDKSLTSTNKSAISSLSVNLGKISQNSLNFVARVHLLPAQKNQKTTAIKARRGFVNFI
ncbi:hypothetical protein ACLB6K_24720 (plasmid) [Microcystis aeruginosa FACHB-524]|uniref:hypothetical protein n=1 Tax=Microcystis aeruginosa TaxID=1126 RepID=UPI000F44E6B6|nr:hypothetical protein [Microcystis aeruginosa]ROI07340.1 hypothetical protein ED562_07900 [Microcystis aeruginosa FACHB-524]